MKKPVRALIVCEESQAITKEMRKAGHEAYSCDLQECSGGHPEWHVQGDAIPLLNGRCRFQTMDGEQHEIEGRWDLLICHPPCTYLSTVTTRHLSLKLNPAEKVVERMWKLAKAAVFFMQCALADCERIAVENPAGFMGGLWRKPDQVIHPYYFAKDRDDLENYQKKRTCLWLKGLKPLERTNDLPPPEPYGFTKSGRPINFEEAHGRIKGLDRHGASAKLRSKTFSGIAREMVRQWLGDSGTEQERTEKQ